MRRMIFQSSIPLKWQGTQNDAEQPEVADATAPQLEFHRLWTLCVLMERTSRAGLYILTPQLRRSNLKSF